MKQNSLFQKYCLDACSILDFWEDKPRTRPYHVKVKSFRVIWDYISSKVTDGTILIPRIVADEVDNITDSPELKKWLKGNRHIFVATSEITNELTNIVNKYQIYTTDKGSLGDAVLMALALNRGLTVITSEVHVPTQSPVNPKIPNVCDDFRVKWMNLPEFFEAEGL